MVLYTGFTDDLEFRVEQHKSKYFPKSFTARYNCNKLVYFEEYGSADDALYRENQLKRYRRAWKEELIDEFNPEWKDLSGKIYQ